MTELKAVVVNLKSLDQDIKDPIIIGGGDANSRSLKVIFTQEAQAQLTPETKVYLKWHHQELDIDGYNVFDKCIDSMHRYNIWEIKWPQKMHHEGNVLCCIELVDKMSIGQTVNFIVHVMKDPHGGEHFTVTDDFTDFQNACIALATLREDVADQFAKWKIEFAGMKQLVEEGVAEAKEIANDAVEKAELAIAIAMQHTVTKDYVDTQDAATLAASKAYTDEKVGEGGLPREITDPHQGQILMYHEGKEKWINKNLVDEQSIIYLDEETAGLAIKGYKQAPQGYMLVKDRTQGIAWVKPTDTSTLEQYVQQAQQSASQAGTYATQAGNAAIEAIEAKIGAEAAQEAVEAKMWYGTMAQYNALETINPTTFYFILDGEIKDD